MGAVSGGKRYEEKSWEGADNVLSRLFPVAQPIAWSSARSHMLFFNKRKGLLKKSVASVGIV